MILLPAGDAFRAPDVCGGSLKSALVVLHRAYCGVAHEAQDASGYAFAVVVVHRKATLF